jgi:hypothetical protein
MSIEKKEKDKKSHKTIEVKKDDKESQQEVKDWVDNLYKTDLMSDDELNLYYDTFKYKGFDRNEILIKLKEKAGDVKTGVQLVILCALQGPVRASKTKLLNGRTPTEMGIPASGQQGSQNISCARIVSATADLAAFYLKKIQAPKRLDVACPAWLQFPAAGSIKMSEELREQHIDFSKKFSVLIKGQFREDIYRTMVMNAYLSNDLRLFLE